MRRWVWIAVVCVAGCETTFVEWADERGASIQEEKMAVVENFRKNLDDPIRGQDKGAAPQSEYEFDPAVPEVIQLEDAIRIATQYNRNYLGQRENFFLSMLGLDSTRHNFLDPNFSGSISWGGSVLEGAQLSESTQIALSGSKLLPTGGSISVNASQSVGSAKQPGLPRAQAESSSLTLGFSMPLLRGAGRTVAWEGLVAAERSAVYSARSFESFRQTFAINVIRRYYELVNQKKTLVNAERNTKNQELALREAKALFRLGRGQQLDVLLAEPALINAKNAELEAKQTYADALDNFKIFLGLPLSVDLRVGEEAPPVTQLSVDVESAIDAALHNRLDLATARDQFDDSIRGLKIAKNSLLPDLSVNASGGVAATEGFFFEDFEGGPWTASAGFSLEIPLDRVSERNQLRSALIGVAQSRRSLRAQEDGIIIEVRAAVRNLNTLFQQIENQKQLIETQKKRVIKARIEENRGSVSNRDRVEAQQQVTDAQDALIRANLDYYLAVLNLRRTVGLLYVDKEGRIIE
ncbi:MAG: TolC family protein [Planctomycetota bacterium]|jgi:outer membrane protein TolC